MSHEFSATTQNVIGLYKCEAKKNYRKMSVVLSVKTAEKATSCTATAPEHGMVVPEEVEIGGTVSYNCDEDYFLSGNFHVFFTLTQQFSVYS